MSQPATLNWFARHELTLFWRDWMSMMSAGKRTREWLIKLVLTLFVVGLHGLAYVILAPKFAAGVVLDKVTFVTISGTVALSFFMMLSQSLESVTRAFYARSDLDLILSSPAPSRHLFAIRIAAITVTSAGMATMLATPFINVAAALGGAQWLAAYPAMLALSAISTAISIVAVIVLLRYVGPKRTRLISQIVAAIVGASFLIGIQIAAIMSQGTMSRLAFFSSKSVVDWAPGADSFAWWPARAVMGEPLVLISLVVFGFALLGAVIHLISPAFGDYATATAGVGEHSAQKSQVARTFTPKSVRANLRAKEWQLLRRDPWLVSQTLMQILYLIPPAFLLWRNFGDEASGFVILAPVLVMAIGQLAGGLSWLAISGEDAPDLIASAPLKDGAVLRAKIEAVLGVILVVAGPILLFMAFSSPWAAMMTGLGLLGASVSAITIQMWFRSQAKRSMFRRRQVSSRAATFSEAFTSIMWAGAACLAVAGSLFAIFFAVLALLVLGFARLVSPPRD